MAVDARWPELSSPAWPATYATLHMWTQVVGKIRLALTPYVNHWWQVALYVTTRGITTSPIPYAGGLFDIRFDFVEHSLTIGTDRGVSRIVPLEPQSVAEFYSRVMRALGELQIDARIWPMPVEVPAPIRFDRDFEHATYDRTAANAWWRLLSNVDAVLKEFRGRFIGKSSPVHFFWGSFDLAVTRFSGRRAPERPDADRITREAYSHEVFSAGFWPGSGAISEPAFYSYAAPQPDGFKDAAVRPSGAFYSAAFGEFVLKYEDVRRLPDPRAALLDFFQSTYDAGATLAKWNRAELEAPPAHV